MSGLTRQTKSSLSKPSPLVFSGLASRARSLAGGTELKDCVGDGVGRTAGGVLTSTAGVESSVVEAAFSVRDCVAVTVEVMRDTEPLLLKSPEVCGVFAIFWDPDKNRQLV